MAEGKKLGVSVVISAVDQVTAKFREINQKIAATTAPVRAVQASVASLGQESGIRRMGEVMGQVSAATRDVASEMGSLIRRFAWFAAGAGGAGAALFGVVKSFSSAGDEVKKTAYKLGLGTTELQEWTYAASAADIPAEQFHSSLTRLTKGIGEAASGTGEALNAFNAIGISVFDARGKIKSLGEILPELTSKLSGIHSASLRNRIAMMVFGREGANLSGLFKEGAGGIRELRHEAHKLGVVMGKEALDSADQFDGSLKRLMASFGGVKNAIGAAFAPVLTPILDGITKAITENQGAIRKWSEDAAKSFPSFDQIKNGFNKLKQEIKPVTDLIQSLTDRFGTVNLAIGTFAILVGAPAVLSVVTLGKELILLSGHLALVGYRLGVLAFGPVIAAIGNFITALRAGYSAMAAFNLVLAANPIGLVIMGVAALAGAAYLVYKNWEPIKRFFSELWDDPLKKFKEFTGWVSSWFGKTASTPSISFPEKPSTYIQRFKTEPKVTGYSLKGLYPSQISGASDLNATSGRESAGALSSRIPPDSFDMAQFKDQRQTAGAADLLNSIGRASSVKQESVVKVIFDNLPPGTRVRTEKSEVPVDLSLGFSMVHP